MLLLVAGGTYVEFVYFGPPTLYSVVLWLIVVPLLLSTTVHGVRSHPLYQPLVYGSFIAIGVLQYLDTDWFLLGGLFILAGIVGFVSELRNQYSTRSSRLQ
jgi:hypothetical protein